MKKSFFYWFILLIVFVMEPTRSFSQEAFEADSFRTAMGMLTIHFIGHGTLMMQVDGKVIHVDPVMQEADYRQMPDADLVLVTHEHGDHLDVKALEYIVIGSTQVIITRKCQQSYPKGIVLNNGDRMKIGNIEVEAVPAYNIVNKRPDGRPFHPRGEGNGYVIRFENFSVYVAGDTENVPEMKNLKNIDVAFLPMNLPYTMTADMVRDAALSFRPRILYPYHYGTTDTGELIRRMEGEKGIEVRIRDLK